MVTEAGAAGLLLAMLPRDGCLPSELRNTRHSCFPNTTRCISEMLNTNHHKTIFIFTQTVEMKGMTAETPGVAS